MFISTVTGNGGKRFGRRYPWTEWFSRARTILVRGIDFDCYPHGMRQNILSAARNHLPKGKRISLRVREHTIVINVIDKEEV